MKWLRRRKEFSSLDAELRAEREFHLAMRAEQLQQEGHSPSRARAEARKQFGNATSIHEETRRMHIRPFLEAARQDARYAWRSFRRQPAFALTALMAVALGVGACTAVFSVVDRILFRALPYAEADRLVSVGMAAPIEPQEFTLGMDYIEWRARQQPFAVMTSWSGVSECDLTYASPQRVRCARVESTFLPTLGVRPVMGRQFTRQEDQPNANRVALLSYALWRSRFGADPSVVGRTFSLDGQSTEVAGVLPADFELPNLAAADLVLPQALNEAGWKRPMTGAVLRTYARLKPGVSIAQATAAMQPLFQEALRYVPEQFRKEVRLRVRTLRERQTEEARAASWALLGAVAAVLLIACANVANLLLARSASRRRELAVRAALGAGRGRLARQALTESLSLALTGGVLGCPLALGLLRGFVAIAPEGMPRLAQATLDARVLGFSVLCCVACGLLFGLAPALDRPAAETLAGWRTIGSRRQWFRQSLVAAQIAVSLMLLTGAALLLRSLLNLQAVPLGIKSEGLVAAHLVLGQQQYGKPEQQLAFFERLEQQLKAQPGVGAVAISDSLPPGGLTRSRLYATIEIEGQPSFAGGTGGMVVWRAVTPEYFDTMGIRILQGRAFQDEDRRPTEHGIILSQALARRLLPGRSALGQRLLLGRTPPWHTVIGVAADVKNSGLTATDDPEYYLVRQHTPEQLRRVASVVLRSPWNTETAAQWIRTVVAKLDPAIPVTIETMPQRVQKLAERPRFNAVLLSLFAGMGVFLAAVGLYGVMAFLVAQRTQEIGIRMALGASRQDVTRMVLSDAGVWTTLGAATGLIGSLATGHWLQSLLFQVPGRDPLAFALASLVLTATALGAAWLPSRRAARVDPLVALRQE